MQIFDAHVDLTLKLYLMSHAFQIPNFRFSLEWVAREDNYHNTKWNQSQSLSIRDRRRISVILST